MVSAVHYLYRNPKAMGITRNIYTTTRVLDCHVICNNDIRSVGHPSSSLSTLAPRIPRRDCNVAKASLQGGGDGGGGEKNGRRTTRSLRFIHGFVPARSIVRRLLICDIYFLRSFPVRVRGRRLLVQVRSRGSPHAVRGFSTFRGGPTRPSNFSSD